MAIELFIYLILGIFGSVGVTIFLLKHEKKVVLSNLPMIILGGVAWPIIIVLALAGWFEEHAELVLFAIKAPEEKPKGNKTP